MKVTVTGASGHIGGNLVRALLEAGHEVKALYTKDTRPLDGLALETQKADVLDPASLETAFEGREVVFHLAGKITVNGDPDGMVNRINGEGVRNVCEAALKKGVRRLVHFSSIHAFQHNPWDQPLDETRPLCIEAPGVCLTYDASKARGEHVVREYLQKGLDAVIVNPTAVLGPIDYKPSAMGGAILMVARKSLPMCPDAGFDWVDVRDIARGAIAAAEKGRKGEKYLLGGKWRPFSELAGLVGKEAGVKPPSLKSPIWLAKVGVPFAVAWAGATGTRPLFTFESLTTLATSHKDIRHTKAEKELGYSCRPLEETIADAIRWFFDHGVLSKKAA
ncbi:MAG TPA: SDR family oxidoreductase [Myxococcales bacterium]|jgi:dihydroflavonol-4-reductase